MRRVVLLVTVLLMAALPLRAQKGAAALPVPGPHLAAEAVVKRLSTADLRALLVESGFAIDSTMADSLWLVRHDDLRLLVQLGNDGQLVHCTAAFTDTKATLASVNAWNRENLLSRAYLDEDGDPAIETEIDIEGGVTGARLRDYLRTTTEIVAAFARGLPR